MSLTINTNMASLTLMLNGDAAVFSTTLNEDTLGEAKITPRKPQGNSYSASIVAKLNYRLNSKDVTCSGIDDFYTGEITLQQGFSINRHEHNTHTDLSYTAILQGDNGHALKMSAISKMDEKPFNQNTAALSAEKKCEFDVINSHIEFTASLSANFPLGHPSNFSTDNFVLSFNLSLRHENSREGGGVNIGVTMPGFKNPSFSFSFNLKF
mgnify:CR=1 FL=1